MKKKDKNDYKKYYFPCPPYDYSTFSPWFRKDFLKLYDKIKKNTVVKEDRCYILHKFSDYCSNLEGDFAECGVYKGGTSYLIAYTLNLKSITNKEFHIFDTFKGFPSSANVDPGVLKNQTSIREGTYGDALFNNVKDYLKIFPFIIFHPGIIPETFKGLEVKKFAFVHIDVDLYEPAKDCCNFFYSKMVRGGIMIFDDYGFQEYIYSEKQAVDEFFSDKPESPISLRTGQCIIIKV
ncbi:MAG: TylF/MycF/NovP-related O-methyltransferase [Promethearchaeota archaeon]